MSHGRRRLLVFPFAAAAATVLPAPTDGSALAADLPTVVASAKPSIVAVGLYAPLQSPQFRFLGSGFVVGNGRQIVTCAHVIPTVDPSKRESVAVAVPGPEATKVYQAKLAATDQDADLAVLEFEGPALPPLALADSAEVREGGDVVLLGFPIGNMLGLFPAAHRGVIAAITPMITPAASSSSLRAQNVQVLRGRPLRLLQLDATAFPGNSGGPLLDSETGRVVGVISLSLGQGKRGDAIQYPTGISYAVPVSYLAALLGRL